MTRVLQMGLLTCAAAVAVGGSAEAGASVAATMTGAAATIATAAAPATTAAPAAAATGMGSAPAAAGQIPAELTVPPGEQLSLKAHAIGSQIYTCKAGADGALQWVLKAPEADLRDRKGKVIGHHFAGPTWKHSDGSEVTGKPSAHVDSPDANSIPWLLVAATGHTGKGTFAKVSSIQRLNTEGGKPPAAAECNESKSGAEVKSAYSADYYFYVSGK